MNVECTTSSTAIVKYDTQLPKHASNSPQAIEGDTVHASTQALQLSRNLVLLKEQLRPRDEVLQQFVGNIDEPMDLDDVSLNHIIDRI